MLHLLFQYRENLGIQSIAVAHVNHGLRGSDSDLDEELVESMAGSLQMLFFKKKLSGITLNSSGIEEYCRSERYAFFHHLKKNHNFDYIVTAHTADDQAETLLMRIIRGCGVRGLAGVHAVRDDAVIRPLLGITKKELQGFLKNNGIAWREDLTNTDTKFLRNNIRHNVLPLLESLNPEIREHLVTLGKSAADVMKLVDTGYADWKAKYVIDQSGVHFELSRSGFSVPGVAEFIAHAMHERGIECSGKKLNTILDNCGQTSGRILISGGWSMYGARSSMIFLKDGYKIPSVNEIVACQGETQIYNGHMRITFENSETFERNADKYTAYVDTAFLMDSLVVRTIEADDCFVPLGRKKKISVLSFLESQGHSRIDRERMVVLMSGQDVVWIPGVRLSDGVKVTNSTKSITKISFQLHVHIL